MHDLPIHHMLASYPDNTHTHLSEVLLAREFFTAQSLNDPATRQVKPYVLFARSVLRNPIHVELTGAVMHDLHVAQGRLLAVSDQVI